MPMGMPPPGAGAANPANLQALAAAGDPRAIAMLQQMGAGAPQGAGGGMPPGGPGGMPPAGAMPPAGQLPGMSQSEFGGAPIPPDVQARRAQQLIQMLRARGDAR